MPASQVLGTYLTGFGCSNEHEVVVLGHETIKSYPVLKQDAAELVEAVANVRLRTNTKKAKQ